MNMIRTLLDREKGSVHVPCFLQMHTFCHLVQSPKRDRFLYNYYFISHSLS